MRTNYIAIILIALVAVVAGCTDSAVPDQDISNTQEQPVDDTEIENTSSSNNTQEETENRSNTVENTSDSSGTVDESEVREIVIEGGNYYFDNETINVEQGEKVRIVLENVGGYHDLRVTSEEIGTEKIQSGETDSFTNTFEETGSYEFICSVGNHAARGMTGIIEVS